MIDEMLRDKILRAVIRYELIEGSPASVAWVNPSVLEDSEGVLTVGIVEVRAKVGVPEGCVWV